MKYANACELLHTGTDAQIQIQMQILIKVSVSVCECVILTVFAAQRDLKKASEWEAVRVLDTNTEREREGERELVSESALVQRSFSIFVVISRRRHLRRQRRQR